MKSYCLVGENIYPDALKKLAAKGFCIKMILDMPRLDPAVASHIDLSLFHFKNMLFVSPYCLVFNKTFLESLAKEKGFTIFLTEDRPHSPYPNDVPLCVKAIGERALIANKDFAAPEILEYFNKNNIPVFHTNQGYAACSTLSFGNAVISADDSILKAAKEAGADTLKISQGNILLPPYPYGFIGGCCGVCDHTIYFNGNLDLHPDAESIRAFADKHSFSCVSLCDSPLYDIGGIIFI